MFLKDRDVLLDIIRGTHNHRYLLMEALRLDVQDVGGPCGGHPSGLLHDEGHGVALIEQSELKRVEDKQSFTNLYQPPPIFIQEHLSRASFY